MNIFNIFEISKKISVGMKKTLYNLVFGLYNSMLSEIPFYAILKN